MTKTNYETHIEPRLTEIGGWARDGLTDAQIIRNLKISRAAFIQYKKKYPVFSEALRVNKEAADYEVENALFKRATGYYSEEKTVAKVKRVEYDPGTGKKLLETEEFIAAPAQKYYPPEMAAIKFWLGQRQREKWGDAENEAAGEIRIVMDAASERYSG